jgi:hypothetical protein
MSRLARFEQQHQRDDSHQRQQRFGVLIAERGAARGSRHQLQMHLQEFALDEGRRFGKLLLLHFQVENLVEQRLQTGLRFFPGDAGLETAEDFHPAEAAVAKAVERAARRQTVRHRHRDANLRRISGPHAVKTGLADADDRERIPIHHDLLAQDARSPAKRFFQ